MLKWKQTSFRLTLNHDNVVLTVRQQSSSERMLGKRIGAELKLHFHDDDRLLLHHTCYSMTTVRTGPDGFPLKSLLVGTVFERSLREQ